MHNLDYGNSEAMVEYITKLIGEIEAAMKQVDDGFVSAGGDTQLHWFDVATEDWLSRCHADVEKAKTAMSNLVSQVNATIETSHEMENV